MPRADAMGFAAVNTLHSCRTLAFESYPGDQCVSQHRQIRPVHVGEGIRTKYGLALSIAKPYVQDRAAPRSLHHATVLIFKGWDPDRTCSFKHGQSNWAGIRYGLDKNRPARSTVLWVWRSMPILRCADKYSALTHSSTRDRRPPMRNSPSRSCVRVPKPSH